MVGPDPALLVSDDNRSLMMDKPWPDEGVCYEEPFETASDIQRWQEALDKALANRTLQLIPGRHPDLYTLSGECPRCMHATAQPVEFNIHAGGLRRGDVATFNFSCKCREGHPPGSDQRGCGWGGPIAVTVNRPEADHANK